MFFPQQICRRSTATLTTGLMACSWVGSRACARRVWKNMRGNRFLGFAPTEPLKGFVRIPNLTVRCFRKHNTTPTTKDNHPSLLASHSAKLRPRLPDQRVRGAGAGWLCLWKLVSHVVLFFAVEPDWCSSPSSLSSTMPSPSKSRACQSRYTAKTARLW